MWATKVSVEPWGPLQLVILKLPLSLFAVHFVPGFTFWLLRKRLQRSHLLCSEGWYTDLWLFIHYSR